LFVDECIDSIGYALKLLYIVKFVLRTFQKFLLTGVEIPCGFQLLQFAETDILMLPIINDGTFRYPISEFVFPINLTFAMTISRIFPQMLERPNDLFTSASFSLHFEYFPSVLHAIAIFSYLLLFTCQKHRME
jgi:hypothetical protein